MDYIPLRMGASGPQVRQVQRILAHLGYPVGKVDGKFGVRTQRAVIAFQSANELPVDGVVAANTWMALERRAGGVPTAPEPQSEPLPMSMQEATRRPMFGGRFEPLIPPMPPMILPESPPMPPRPIPTPPVCVLGGCPPVQIMPLINWMPLPASVSVPTAEPIPAMQIEASEEVWRAVEREPVPVLPPQAPPPQLEVPEETLRTPPPEILMPLPGRPWRKLG